MVLPSKMLLNKLKNLTASTKEKKKNPSNQRRVEDFSLVSSEVEPKPKIQNKNWVKGKPCLLKR
jgi:hypothetical protein